MWKEIMGIAQIPDPEPLDPELARLLSSDLGSSRESLIEAMKLSDANREQKRMAEVHLRAGQIVNEIDELADLLRQELES